MAAAASSSPSPVGTVLELSAADDFHLHIRDDPWLACLSAAVCRQFRRGLIMPNLKPPITTTDEALAYHKKIESSLCAAYAPNQPPPFTPLMTLYLTHSTTPEEIKRASSTGIIVAAKLYPCGATTHSQSGVILDRLGELCSVFQSMSDNGMLLLIHGEVTDPSVDIFDRERVFIEQFFIREKIHEKFPKLKIVVEHISSAFAVQFIKELKNTNVAATITAHHLLYNRAALLVGGLNSHYYCLPILKAEADRIALLDAATSGNPRFFAGTDSAPHPKSSKLSTPAPAGCYTAFAAIELYAEAFDSLGRLSALEGFLCRFGAEFYGLHVFSKGDEDGKANIRLIKKSWTVPRAYYLIAPQSSNADTADQHLVVPIRSGGEIQWKLEVHPSREPSIKLSIDDAQTHK